MRMKARENIRFNGSHIRNIFNVYCVFLFLFTSDFHQISLTALLRHLSCECALVPFGLMPVPYFSLFTKVLCTKMYIYRAFVCFRSIKLIIQGSRKIFILKTTTKHRQQWDWMKIAKWFSEIEMRYEIKR